MNAFSILSAVVLLLALMLHLVTFIPGVKVSLAYAAPLIVLVILPFIIMVKRMAIGKPKAKDSDLDSATKYSLHLGAKGFVALFVLVNYAVIGSLISASRIEGDPNSENGRYYITDHGRFLRNVSEDEYWEFKAYEVRSCTGILMLLAVFPYLHFGRIEPQLADQRVTERGDT